MSLRECLSSCSWPLQRLQRRLTTGSIWTVRRSLLQSSFFEWEPRFSAPTMVLFRPHLDLHLDGGRVQSHPRLRLDGGRAASVHL